MDYDNALALANLLYDARARVMERMMAADPAGACAVGLTAMVVYLQSQGYSVTPDAGDVPFDNERELRVADVAARVAMHEQRFGVSSAAFLQNPACVPDTYESMEWMILLRALGRAEPPSVYVVPPSSTCQCYLCRQRWGAVLEAGSE